MPCAPTDTGSAEHLRLHIAWLYPAPDYRVDWRLLDLASAHLALPVQLMQPRVELQQCCVEVQPSVAAEGFGSSGGGAL